MHEIDSELLKAIPGRHLTLEPGHYPSLDPNYFEKSSTIIARECQSMEHPVTETHCTVLGQEACSMIVVGPISFCKPLSAFLKSWSCCFAGLLSVQMSLLLHSNSIPT